MPVYKKPSESTLVNQVMRILSFYENVGKVIWFSRLQSGSVKVIKRWGPKRYENWMHLCRKGTPDIMAIMNDGIVLWLELKAKDGTIRDEQTEFNERIGALGCHHTMILQGAVGLNELEKWIGDNYK